MTEVVKCQDREAVKVAHTVDHRHFNYCIHSTFFGKCYMHIMLHPTNCHQSPFVCRKSSELTVSTNADNICLKWKRIKKKRFKGIITERMKWKEGEEWVTTLQRDGLKRSNIKSVWSDGSPPTALPVVEQIGAAAELSDCLVDQAAADRWLPPSAGHRAVHSLHWFEVSTHTHTQHSWHPHAQPGGLRKWERESEGHGCLILKMSGILTGAVLV